jgi:hypothetical protein
MREFLDWLNREIELHETAGDAEIESSGINPVPEIFKDALQHSRCVQESESETYH